MNVNDMTEEIRQVYAERDRLREENEALRQFKTDICEAIEIRRDARNDTIIKALKADKARTQLDVDDNRMCKDILDEIKTYFKMTASHWKYNDIPHFVKTAHEFALEKREDAEEQAKQLTEDICAALGIRPDMRTKKSILEEIRKLRAENEAHKYNVKKQEEFTEEAASILGVHPGDLSLSDILAALRKLKRYEELNNMNCEIIADLRTELDQSQRAFSGEHSRRLAAEKYISDTFQRAAKELGMTCIPDGIDRLCDEIADLRNYRNRISCPKEFWESMCDIMEMDAADATPSDVVGMTREAKKRLISVLALNPDTATWTDIYDAIKAEQKDHCNLISESYKMKNELEELKHADERRREWVRKYKSEHERANSCDELYKKYKALYDADAPEREKLSDTLQSYRASYEAVKNEAVKNRSLMSTVANIVGTVGMHDDVTLTGVLNARKKANHWDVLVDGYGEGTIRSLLDNIGIDVSGDKGNGLFG